jgi:hypothetical protein
MRVVVCVELHVVHSVVFVVVVLLPRLGLHMYDLIQSLFSLWFGVLFFLEF